MTLQLRPYQVRALAFASANPGTYQMVDLGLGKTAVALYWSDAIGNPTLVVAPLMVAKNTWPSEIKKWTPWRSYAILHGKYKLDNLRIKNDIYILNYEGLKWFYETMYHSQFKMPPYTLILDESSWIKDPRTKRFKMLKALDPYLSMWRMNLSATPATKGLHGLWSQYFMLDHGRSLGSKYGAFIKNLFDVGMPPYSIKTPKARTATKIYKAIAPITYRLDRADHLEIPPLLVNDIKLDLPSRLRSSYDTMVSEFAIKLHKHQVSIANSAALSMKLRQFLQGGLYIQRDSREYEMVHYEKMYLLRDLLIGLEGKPVLIPIQFRFEVKELTGIIGKFHTLIGGQKSSYSSQVIESWNRGKISKIVCHPATISYGLNLQGGGHNIIWVGLPWSTDHYHQLNGRLHRQGQTNAVVVNRIMFKDTIDEVVAATLADNTKDQQDLFNAISSYMRSV